MNENIPKVLTIEDLKAYRKQNPVKFKHKFGDINLDNVEEGFNVNLYKYQVTQERVRREQQGIPQDFPITPEDFKVKVVKPKAKEVDEVEETDEEESEDEKVQPDEAKAKNVKGGKTLKGKK